MLKKSARVKIMVVDFSSLVSNHWRCAHVGTSEVLKHFEIKPPSFKVYIKEVANIEYMAYYRSIGITAKKSVLRKLYQKGYLLGKPKIDRKVCDALEQIAMMYVAIELVTSAKENFASSLIEVLHISDYLSSSFFHVKDKSNFYRDTLMYRHLETTGCVMVGGVVATVQSGTTAKIISIGMLSNNIPQGFFQDLDANLIASSWDEIPGYLLKLV